jgi:hypothetical protein
MFSLFVLPSDFSLCDVQLIYYVPNVLIQIITLILICTQEFPLQVMSASTADAVSSAQATRITRKLWEAGRWQQNHPMLAEFDNGALRPTQELEIGHV